MTETWMTKVEAIATQIAEREACILYNIEFTGLGKGRTLCIYIDTDKSEGVGIDECTRVSNGLTEVLDADDIVPGGEYALEVSSPGLERVLNKPWHYSRAVGKTIYIKTTKPLEAVGIEEKRWKAAKTVEGKILSADDSAVMVLVKEGELKIPFNIIEKAKLVFEVTKGQKK